MTTTTTTTTADAAQWLNYWPRRTRNVEGPAGLGGPKL